MKIPGAILVVSILAVQYQQVYGAEISEEIFNGKPAKRGDFPYQALVLSHKSTDDPNSYYKCGGSLISPKYVLTAGHCTYGYDTSNIFLGVISTTDLTPPGSFFDTVSVPDNVVFHPNYKFPTTNDVAIVKLNKDAPLSQYIRSIALPRYSWRAIDHYKNQYATASGFGLKYTGGTNDNTLDYTKQIIMAQDDCKAFYSDLKDYFICTEKKKIYAGPCEGDSGGPLAVVVRNAVHLAGVVSFGQLHRCNQTYPEGYSNVAYYLPFIKNVTGLPYRN